MAVGAVKALNKRGLSVPGDVSVMSTDGFNWRKSTMCR